MLLTISQLLLSVFSICVFIIAITIPQSSSTLQSQENKSDSVAVHAFDTLRIVPNSAFKSGEHLKFDVNYGFVTAGEAILKVTDTMYQNRKCYWVEFSLNSKPFFDVFYKVRDRYYTMIDAEGMFPWRFEQHIREGGYSRDFVAEFDQINNKAITSEGEYPIPPYVQDIMSAFYFVRTVDFSDFNPGQKIYLKNFYKDSTYELGVKFKGRQTIKVEAGKFNCIIVEPLAKEGGLFKSEGRIYVWLTDDELRMPVLVTAKIIIGNVESELIAYKGIPAPIRARISND